MNIVIDARMINWTGIGRYTWNLLDQLQDIDRDNSYTVLLLKKDFASWQPKSSNFKKLIADFEPYSISEQLRLPFFVYKLKADLVHFPHFTAPLLYFKRRVVTIHDLTLVYYKTNRGDGLKKAVYGVKYWAMRLVLRCAAMATAVITDTEFVRQELLARYGRQPFKLNPNRITTTLLSVDPLMAQAEQPEMIPEGAQFLLYVGNYYPNKNTSRLIDEFTLTRAKYPELKLVLTGKADYFQEQLRTKARELGLADAIIFTDFVSDGELVWLYQNARAYVFPSLSEGFGLPPLEAMAQGTPVIASSASCIPEVCGDAAIYFDPLKPADIADKIMGVLQNKELQERLSAKGLEHIDQFSWRRMAEQTLVIYQASAKSR
jgi:glycosyltransferase involved in cell wall biosynthesis